MYDPRAERVHISRDVVFDEGASWSWEAPGAEEDGRGWSSFTIDYTVYRGAREATGDEDADAGEAEQSGARSCRKTPPAAQGTPPSAETSGSMRFVMPPPGAENLDADYDNEPLRFRAVDNIIGDASPPEQAVRNLDGELFMARVKEPRSLGEAEADARWRRAMKKMASIQENATWELVDPPAGCRPIGLKWVYKVKKNERGNVVKHKARPVAKGERGSTSEEVFAPVARMDSVRLLLAHVHHLDVKSAFLNGELREVVYVQQPPGFAVAGEEDKVLRLQKALHGLRQAPRAWNIKLDSTLVTLGFKKGASEHALYTRRSKEGILIVGSEQQEIGMFKAEMVAKFKMSDLGLLSYYLGIEVRQGKHAIELCQSAYAQKLLERAGLKGCNPTQVPMQEKPKLSKNSTEEKVDATLYRSLSGGLRYFNSHTARYLFCCRIYLWRTPHKNHMAAVKHLLRYIAGSCELGLAYPRRKKNSDLHLIGFSDSDMGEDLDGRTSTSGMVFFLETCPISWQSQKQKIVALSTCEAEYIAGAAAACQGVWLRRLLEKITGQTVTAPILGIDNHSAIELAKNPVLHSRSKHIDIKFHFIRDCVEKRQVILEQVGTSQQLADVFTKPLRKNKFEEMKTQVGMV
ncbi:LOW QUALITY PROTEIN: hypothetical protein U9M48_031113, partial [Paspalum notatum var. saurae]